MSDSHHEEEVLGKAYDARLMRRRDGGAGVGLDPVLFRRGGFGPVLHQGSCRPLPQARRQPAHAARRLPERRSLHRHLPGCHALPADAACGFRAAIPADLSVAGHRAEADVRSAYGNLRPLAAHAHGLFRSQPCGASGHTGHHGRERAERDVYLRGRNHLRRRVDPGADHGGDAENERAAGPGNFRRVAADRLGHALVPEPCPGVVSPDPHRYRAHQRLSSGTHHRDDGATAFQP